MPTAEQATLASNISVLSFIPDYLGFTESYFKELGKEVIISATKAYATWISTSTWKRAVKPCVRSVAGIPRRRVFAVHLPQPPGCEQRANSCSCCAQCRKATVTRPQGL